MKPMGTKTLETDRLILRKFTPEDAEDMYENWASDPEVTKYLTWPVHTSVDVTKKLLEIWVQRYRDDNSYNWAIEYKETGRVIGNISVVKLNEAVESADMGYCMSRALWGRGIMPEALKAVIAFLFDEVGLNRIAACHDPGITKDLHVIGQGGLGHIHFIDQDAGALLAAVQQF